MTLFRWCTAPVGTLPISPSVRAAHQAAQAHFVTFSQGAALSRPPSSQRRDRGDQMGYVSAVLHLEPWTSFLLFFGWFPVLVPVSFQFPRHRRFCSRVRVFTRLRLSELCTPGCDAKRKRRNPGWTAPVWQREVLLLRPKLGRGFISRGVTCL